MVLFGQGIPFIHAGQEFLRSKSMDRDSFNSGDWFNAIDWSLADVNWGHGLPIAEKNQDNWPIMGPLLADAALALSQADAQLSLHMFRELLRVRSSIRLLRLRSAEQIHDILQYHNTGPGQVPGVVISSLRDDAGVVDRRYESVVVALNARPDTSTVALPALAQHGLALHPILAQSADVQLRTASYAESGTFLLPPRSASVFVASRQPGALIEWLTADIDQLVDAGELSPARAQPLRQILWAASRLVHNGRAAWAVLLAFEHHVRILQRQAHLDVAAGDALRMHSSDIRSVLTP